MAANVKCSITSSDDGASVEAYFNPREITLEKQVPWNEQKTAKADAPNLEFTDSGSTTLTVELLFDTYETGGDVYTTYLEKLEGMAKVLDPESDDPEQKRPHKCLFKWGAFPPFRGVMEQLAVKYTMFFGDGTPCRATATVKLKEYRGANNGGSGTRSRSPGTSQGQTVSEGDARRADRFGPNHRTALESQGSEDGRLTAGAPVVGRRH